MTTWFFFVQIFYFAPNFEGGDSYIMTKEQVLKQLKKEHKQNPNIRVTLKYLREKYPGFSKTEYGTIKDEFEAYKKSKIADKLGLPKESSPVADPIFDNLSDKERIFCLEYLNNYNIKNASYKAGYTPDEGRKLIGTPKISNALKEYQKKREQELFVDGMSLIRLYVEIAFADMGDYVDFGNERVPLLDQYGNKVYDKEGRLVTTQRNYMRLKDSTTIDCRVIQEIKEGRDGVSVKLFDKVAALDKLAKIFDLNNDAEIKALELEIKKAKLQQELAKAKILSDNEDKELNVVIRHASKEVVV